MSNPLFYDNPIALNSQTHRNLKIKPSDDGLKFSGKTNSVLLAGIEFPEACKHFPIVFAKVAGPQVLPLALLGFRDRENLFVDAGGRWKGEYVPAYIRRYPFVLAKGDAEQKLTVCIDESYPGFGADEGQPLFNGKGESTDYLKGVLTFLQDYQKQLERTDLFLQTLRELDLLVDVAAKVKLPGGERFSIAGLMMVDERKLNALPEAQILRLFRSGELAWVYSHLLSISNFNRMPGKALTTNAALPEKASPARTAAPDSVAPAPGRVAPATSKTQVQAQKPGKK
ncbi:MAG: SapC family protein [Pseudomonadota bacterium]